MRLGLCPDFTALLNCPSVTLGKSRKRNHDLKILSKCFLALS